MNSCQVKDQRNAGRVNLVTFCPVVFQYHGHEISAMMVNLSEKGAAFKFTGSYDRIRLTFDEVIAYTVKTPYGTTEFSAHTVWTHMVDDGYEWGVRFTDLCEDKVDPLRCLIDSPF